MATIFERKNDRGQVIGFQVKIRRRGYPSQSQTFDRKSDAERWARKIEREMDDGVFVDRTVAHETTLADLIDMYLREVTPEHGGAKQEELRLKQMQKARIAQYAVAKVRNHDFAEWRDQRLTEVSGGTVIRELNAWHAIIEHGRKEWGVNLHENPVHLVKRPSAAPGRERRLEPTDGEGMTEEDWLLAACDADKDIWMGAIVRLAIETGMRQGEILGLLWDDVVLRKDMGTARVRKAKTDNQRTDGGRGRTIPLSARARAVLQGLPRTIGGQVFPIEQTAFKMRFKRCALRAGIEGLTFHDLRHEATSRLFEKGLEIMEVASITGHKSLSMLKRYTHLHAPQLSRKLG